MIRWALFIAAAAVGCASSPSEFNGMADDSAYRELRQRVAEVGTLQVIVGVRVDGSESSPPSPEAIRQAQDALMASLPPDHVEEASRFSAIPFIVLRVDAEGLEALIASSLVTSLEEDLPSPPAQ